ncbi:MAG: hypothetical protein GX491_14515 [Chloroflexi bacterium]|nr:hypothetical protein [Chloroflexota bacterium]
MNPRTFSKQTWGRILLPVFIILIIVVAAAALLSSQPAKRASSDGYPERLAFYYGFPSQVNDSGGNTQKATQVFKEYDIVVFGNTLDSPSNQDHDRAKTIINNLKRYGTRVYGYIDLCYDGGNYCSSLPLSEIYASTDRWAEMGAYGIFFDQVGFEYSVSRDRLNAALDYVHSKGLSAFVNVWDPDDVFSETVHEKFNPTGVRSHLGPQDYFLHESFAVTLSEYQDPAFLIEKSEKALKWKKLFGTKMATVNTTAFTNPPFEQEKADYVWWMTLLYGYDAMAWGETGIYSADCQCLPFRQRPDPGPIGEPVEPLVVSHDGSLHSRRTTAGIIEVDTAAHTGRFIAGAPPAPPIVQNYLAQKGSQDTGLISANAVFLLGAKQLNLTVQSSGAPIDGYRIFLDPDNSSKTGFRDGDTGGIGADFLVENGQLYQFAGSDQAAWEWAPVGEVIAAGQGTDRVQVDLPFSQIGYIPGSNLGILVQQLDASNQPVDMLPRSPETWVAQSAPKRADNMVNQQGSKAGELVYGSVTFSEGKLLVTARNIDAPIDSFRIYLDMDVNSTTGFVHSGNLLIGAEYLIENDQLFAFGGSDQSEWNWSAVGPVTVSGAGSSEIQAAVPLSQIDYKTGKNLAVLVETLNKGGQASVDLLPRSPHVWLIEYASKDVVVFTSPEIEQTAEKGTDLVFGGVVFGEDEITFTLQSHQDPIDSYRVFLDVDANQDTGFTHFRNVNAGSEFLIENGKLYRFTGTSPIQWSWPEVGDVTHTGVGTTQVQVTIPFSQIGYVSKAKLGILIENLDPSWVTYDMVPRSPGKWVVP